MTPSVESVSILLSRAAAIQAELKRQARSDAGLEKELEDVRKELGIGTAATTVEPTEWTKVNDQAKEQIQRQLAGLVARLRKLNQRQIAVGGTVFVLLALLLTGLAVRYYGLHQPRSDTQDSTARDAPTDDRVLDLLEQSQEVQQALVDLAANRAARNAADAKGKAAAAALVEAGSVKVNALADQIDKALRSGGLSERLSSATLILWAKARTDLRSAETATAQAMEPFTKALTPELEGMRTRFFWTTLPERWFEIAWWAEFGTLVGLLFFVAGCLETGVFQAEKISMFATEVLITPLVVAVVFFLFGFTGITTFAPNEAGVLQTVGFAFVLGFAIRRTVGLLDLIKKRFLPDPSVEQATA